MLTRMMRAENAIPVLGVANLERSRHFYEDVLGFSVERGCEPGWHIGSVGRDGHSLMLSEGETSGMTVWIGVEDILPFHDACVASGTEIIVPPQNRPWAYEFRAKDPDGNILWFGSGPLEDDDARA